MDLLSTLAQLAFFVLFVATLWRFIRRRTRLDLAVVAIFASTAAIFSYALLSSILTGQLTWLQPFAVASRKNVITAHANPENSRGAGGR